MRSGKTRFHYPCRFKGCRNIDSSDPETYNSRELAEVDKSLELKTFAKGKKGPYALLGYRNSEPPVLACTNRPFTLKESERPFIHSDQFPRNLGRCDMVFLTKRLLSALVCTKDRFT